MGVTRQFWIPAGRPPSDGAYVRYPAEDLLGILALESARRGAIVVGEDLGTVPSGFTDLLARWGILSSQVLYFARDERGGFLASSQFSDRALVTVNSHDLPPLPGFWRGADVAVRRRAGLLAGASAHSSALEGRENDRRALLNRLAIEGLLREEREPAGDADLVAAVHALLSRTPAPLVGVSLDDLAGETEPVNVPGLAPDEHRSWSRRMRLSLEEIRADAEVARGLEGVRDRAAARPGVGGDARATATAAGGGT
jgi:4-alpha-glucanotransferase